METIGSFILRYWKATKTFSDYEKHLVKIRRRRIAKNALERISTLHPQSIACEIRDEINHKLNQ